LDNTCTRPPARQAAWIHQIHAAGGPSGSITMVVVFVGCLCCCGWTRDVTSSLYVKNGTKISLRLGYWRNILAHPCVHHTEIGPLCHIVWELVHLGNAEAELACDVYISKVFF
jgi:hypothetical protein